ncbi:hypothetical protein Tco_1294720 [Tanacetum coccineum]
MQVQTRLESDVAMAKRRHGNHADTQFVFIPQAKPDTPWRTSVVPPYVSLGQPSMTSLARLYSYSHAGVWSWGHTWGETNACLSVYHTAVLIEALKGYWNTHKLPGQEFTSTGPG